MDIREEGKRKDFFKLTADMSKKIFEERVCQVLKGVDPLETTTCKQIIAVGITGNLTIIGSLIVNMKNEVYTFEGDFTMGKLTDRKFQCNGFIEVSRIAEINWNIWKYDEENILS